MPHQGQAVGDVASGGVGSHWCGRWRLWRVQRRQRGVLRARISRAVLCQGWCCSNCPRTCVAGDDQTNYCNLRGWRTREAAE